jgi:hypothetical protein
LYKFKDGIYHFDGEEIGRHALSIKRIASFPLMPIPDGISQKGIWGTTRQYQERP